MEETFKVNDNRWWNLISTWIFQVGVYQWQRAWPENRKKIVWCQRKEQFTVEMNNSLGELRYLRGTLEERLYTTNSPQTVAEIAQMIKSHNVPKSQL